MPKKISLSLALELVLFGLIAFFTIRPITNYDFWFHLKYGEFIATTKTIPFVDYFSHTTSGVPIIPYEWLFELILYLFKNYLGDFGVQLLVTSLIIGYIFFFRKIITELIPVPLFARILLCGGLYLIGFDFWVERPQTAAFFLFMVVLYLVLRAVIKKKNQLYLTIPLFWIWTNLHASMILGLYLFFAFAGLFFLFFLKSKDKNDLIWARNFLLFGVINSVVTVLPPLGTKVYELLYVFTINRDFIVKAIDEWAPLANLAERYYLYLTILAFAAISYAASIYLFLSKKHSKAKSILSLNPILLLPLIPLAAFVYTGVRQTPFSMPAIFILTIPLFQILAPKVSISLSRILSVIFLCLLFIGMLLYKNEEEKAIITYPKQAINFIEKNNIQGNMFNEYHLGGYLLYELGPERKTFIDGRTEMFIPEVFPEFMTFSAKTHLPDKDYLVYYQNLVDKYDVSWAILTSARFSLSWRLGRILTNNPNWALIYFDDDSRIFLRRVPKNKTLIDQYEFKSATPFTKSLYKPNTEELALKEYNRMNSITPSSISENALGFLALKESNFSKARSHFTKALLLNPKSAAPKMNLAELAAKDGDLEEAIELYRQAIVDEPERGLAYLRLGQLLIESGANPNKAKEIWDNGVKATPDAEIIKQLNTELETINY